MSGTVTTVVVAGMVVAAVTGVVSHPGVFGMPRVSRFLR
jgi:hypothetical protein